MPCFVSRRAPGSPALSARRVQSMAARMMKHLSLDTAELSVLLCDDSYIHELNRTHRGKDRPTDVLAFALEEADDGSEALPFRVLGDVAISLDTAAKQAKERKQTLEEEVCFLLAHGLLHLLGYDHQTDAEEAEMNAATEQLVRVIQGENSPPKGPLSKKNTPRLGASNAKKRVK